MYLSEPLYRRQLSYRIIAPDEGWKFYKTLKSNPSLINAFDIETAESGGVSEETFDDLTSTTITQIQFATDKYNAYIFPRFEGLYKEIAGEIFNLPNITCGFNCWSFDNPILRLSGVDINESKCHDLMWMFHHYQPKLPRGLQAVAGLYGFPFPWKHLFGSDMELYGGADVCSLHFILERLPALMKARGVYGGYLEYVYKFRGKLLYPAQRLGIPVNEEKRIELRDNLIKVRDKLDNDLQNAIPMELRNVTPKKKLKVKDTDTGKEFEILRYGYEREPKTDIAKASEEYTRGCNILAQRGRKAKSFEHFLFERYSLVQRQFEDIDFSTGGRVTNTRWCKVQPFKASFDQLTRYIKWKQIELQKSGDKGNKEDKKLAKLYEVPKNDKGKDTTAKGELEQLSQKVGADPVFDGVIELRSVNTNINNYVPNWAPSKVDGCVHTRFGFSAASGQIDSRRPNVLNCFDKETEILTKRGWVKFPLLIDGEEVAQFNLEHETIEFVKPLANIKNVYNGKLLNIKTDEQINLCVTPDHDCLLQNRKTKVYNKYPAKRYLEDQRQIQAGTYYEGEISYRESQIILICALQADGHIILNNRQVNPSINFIFTKKRKADRLRDALDLEAIDYNEKTISTGQTRFYIGSDSVPDWLIDKKRFGSWILDLDRESMDFMLDEVFLWDGNSTTLNEFASVEKSNCDWIQILQLLGNRRANLISWQPKGPNNRLMWMVLATHKNHSMTTNYSSTELEYHDFVYCVTVPSGNVVVRRNNKVAITGNCSKHTEYGQLFRGIIEAPKGFTFVEFDKKSFHVAMMGFEANDPSYIRFSQLNPHTIFASYMCPKDWMKPIEMDLSDDEIREKVRWLNARLKEEKSNLRQQAKPVVLGDQLGLGYRKLYWMNRKHIESADRAKYLQEMLGDLFNKVRKFKKYIKSKAHKQTYLINEFGYIQWFFDIYQYHWDKRYSEWKETEGDEARDAIAFAVQSPAFGMIKDEGVRIEPRVEALTGQELAFRLSIHDSLIFLFPDNPKYLEGCIQIGLEEMNKPCRKLVNEATGPEGLKVGVEYTIGRNWKKWDEVSNPEGMREVG